MDTGEILSKLKTAVPGSVLEKRRFGRSAHLSIWVEGKSLAKVAAYLKAEPAFELDWLENLSAIQLAGAIVLTYFVRSSTKDVSLILRASVMPSSDSKEVDLPSVAGVWKMVEPQETEIQELFGVRFKNAQGEAVYVPPLRLPKGWTGFPLRKSYVFPTEFVGIAHTTRSRGPAGNA